MTDLYVLLREGLANTAGAVLDLPLTAKQFDCPAQGCAARSAIPLIYKADAAEWAQRLQDRADAFQLMGTPMVKRIRHNEGHLLFDFTDDFFTLALKTVLRELPGLTEFDLSVQDEDAVKARILYTIRRMWMLARYAADTEAQCPPNEDIQHALLIALAITEEDITQRALTCRLLAASDALLTMTHGVLPRQRPRLCKQCAQVGNAAARICLFGLQRLQEEG